MVHQASLPVFDNVATLQSELSYLIYLVRSTEVWGVKSRVSGDFDTTRRDQALETCRRLTEFLHAPTFVPGKPIPEARGISLDAAAKMGIGAWSKESVNNDHQKLLRAANVIVALGASLTINYNIAFQGSICQPGEKIESRNTLINVQRKVW